MTGTSSHGCRCWERSRLWDWPTAPLDCPRSARSTSSIGRRRRRDRCWLFSRGGICGGELRIRRAETRVATAAASDQDLVAGRCAFHPVAQVVPELICADGDQLAFTVGLRNGAEGARTPDLRHATAALSQLSY